MFFRPSYRADELEDPASAARLKVKRRWLQEAWRVRDEAGGVAEDVPSIADFYRGRHIFVTGGSGFVGKSLVEKLLRMCPDVGAVYMLIRPKKGQTPDDRLQDILSLPVFDRVRKEVPSALDKVFAVRGDCLEDGLGLDEADRRKLIERVSVVFHSAASVRFTEPLKTAVRMNLRPTNDIVQLAREMRQLKVLVHVSTAYSFTNHSPIKECVYETDHDWRDVMKYTDLPDASTLDKLGPKFLGFQPNTYVFTKALAERVMCEAASDLPIVIVRPSIITCSVDEPMVGWIDNMYGFAGFWAAVCKGVWRISYTSRRDIKFDLVPVDAVASMCLGVAWIKGTGQTLSASAGSPEVVNLTVSDLKPGTLDLMQKVLRDNVWNGKVACPGAVRYPDFVVVENKLLALVLVFVYHFMFGVMVDAALLLLNKKPELLAVYRKATFATSALKYFDREFEFDSNNAWHLLARVQPDDRKYFNFILDDRTDDILEVSRQQLLGVCRYALHERIDLARDTRHYTMLWWAEMFWYLILALGALYLLVRRFS